MVLIQLIILMILIFGGLIFILRHILTKNISTATHHLDDLNAEFIEREEEVKKRQDEARQFYETTVNKAKDEADQIRRQAAEGVEEERERIIAEARQQSEAIIQKARKTKEMLVEEIRREVEAAMASRLVEVMREGLPTHIREGLHRLWMHDLLDASLNQLTRMNIPKGLKEIEVKSAFGLTADEKKLLLKKIQQVLGKEVRLKEEVADSLIVGLVITVGSIVLDGSLEHKFKEIIGDHA